MIGYTRDKSLSEKNALLSFSTKKNEEKNSLQAAHNSYRMNYSD
jgi:hypothetical protein